MKKTIAISVACAASALCASDPFVGEYSGTIEGVGRYPYNNDKMMNAQISRHSDGYKLRIFDEPFKRSTEILLLSGLKAKDSSIILDNVGAWKFSGEVTPDEISLDVKVGKDDGKIRLKKCARVSPTLGLKAPDGAKVLFGGGDASKWVTVQEKEPCPWKSNPDGSMTVEKTKGKNADIETVEGFSNFRLHLEFKTPDMWRNESQARGNSGLFIGPYEIQILDSFGNEGRWDDCGAIYRIFPPQVNASLPPETWQTYDIEFSAAKFENGRLVSEPEISVRLNGILVQSRRKIPHGTSLKQSLRDGYRHPQPPYKLRLQEHGDPVSFRNIWIEEI